MYREWIGAAGDYVRWDRSKIIVAIERKLTTAEAIQLVRALHQALIDQLPEPPKAKAKKIARKQ